MTHAHGIEDIRCRGGRRRARPARPRRSISRAQGRSVLLLDRAGRIKPCGGAIPPRLIRDFEIPDELLVARVTSARMVSPSDRAVDMPIDGGFVGMVDRDVFDEWLRERAQPPWRASAAPAPSSAFDRDADGMAVAALSRERRSRPSDGDPRPRA